MKQIQTALLTLAKATFICDTDRSIPNFTKLRPAPCSHVKTDYFHGDAPQNLSQAWNCNSNIFFTSSKTMWNLDNIYTPTDEYYTNVNLGNIQIPSKTSQSELSFTHSMLPHINEA